MFTLPPKAQLTIFALIITMLIAIMIGSEKGAMRLNHLRQQQAQLEQEINELQTESTRLKKVIGRLQTDRKYLEKLAREELNMSRPDEIIYQIK